eukprot:TRINITY_DN1251_c0_g1_i1.p1 TRINITY_DN1251_c0_g1~~TRINITY_DN1251_c0_g1_i1.p1  ORF type:complete len:187 (-),score=49.15 TRINITY_DN1251_c0_g1_i1:291-851(-)
MVKEYKIVVFGDGAVGKSAFSIQFVKGKFVEKYDPTIEEFFSKAFRVDGEDHILNIIDTAGTEQFTSLRETYVKDAQGFILMYSIVTPSSLEALESIWTLIGRMKEESPFAAVMVGNKCDLEGQRLVSSADAEKVASRFGIPLFEASAKDCLNVHESFEELIRELNRRFAPPKREETNKSKFCSLL